MRGAFLHVPPGLGSSSDPVTFQLHCCGLNGPDEYKYANGSLPNSCCLEEVRPCMKREYESYYHNGCVSALYEFMVDKSKVFGAVVLGIALVELFGAFFAFCLVSSVKNSYRRSLYA
ncbi:CD151 antigen-like Protein [Tribolium castaneum]|uniref:CD151 antigen-like Protein n=1 Tax=Tribolium castaneum TaxID=7070 RepID=A0A139WBM3_TRICA|nr:CD151 antigen-like Protein [Tribolium castaneum]